MDFFLVSYYWVSLVLEAQVIDGQVVFTGIVLQSPSQKPCKNIERYIPSSFNHLRSTILIGLAFILACELQIESKILQTSRVCVSIFQYCEQGGRVRIWPPSTLGPRRNRRAACASRQSF